MIIISPVLLTFFLVISRINILRYLEGVEYIYGDYVEEMNKLLLHSLLICLKSKEYIE